MTPREHAQKAHNRIMLALLGDGPESIVRTIADEVYAAVLNERETCSTMLENDHYRICDPDKRGGFMECSCLSAANMIRKRTIKENQ